MKGIRLIKPSVGEEEIEAVKEVLNSGFLTEGKITNNFENAIKSYLGVGYAVATTSCTTALEIGLKALNIGQGDEVIVPDYTHPATAQAVYNAGAEPVFVDVDVETYNINPNEIKKAVTEKTKAIMPVSQFGNPLNYNELNEVKEKYNIKIIEDAACSLGSEIHSNKTGTQANISCFSFHPRKLVTSGEGGMLVTNDKLIAEYASCYKNFGMDLSSPSPNFSLIGTNYKLSNINSAVGLIQLNKLEDTIKKREEKANYYSLLLKDNKNVVPPKKQHYSRHVFQSYSVRLVGFKKNIFEIRKLLLKQGIETQVGTFALHLQPAFKHTKKIGDLKNSKLLYETVLTLPLHNEMSKEDQEFVVDKLAKLAKLA